MSKYIFYVVLLLIFTTLMQCNKNGVSPETQTGAGIFTCKINGMPWTYRNPNYEFLSTKPVTNWEFDKSNMGGYLTISGLRYPDGINSSDFIFLQVDSLLILKEKIIDNFNGYNFGMVYKDYLSTDTRCDEYKTTSLYTSKNYLSSGKLIITKLDQSAKIIAGTFYCTIYQTGCDTLKITDGRFDLKYQ